MPTYGYQCTECKYEFSAFQSMKDDAIAVCPECNGKVKRLLYPVGIVFKGTGWYINDSRAPDKSEKSDNASKTEKSESTPPVAAGADTSVDSKSVPPAKEAAPAPPAATVPSK